jgi:hemerythrin-like domain-containing protein
MMISAIVVLMLIFGMLKTQDAQTMGDPTFIPATPRGEEMREDIINQICKEHTKIQAILKEINQTLDEVDKKESYLELKEVLLEHMSEEEVQIPEHLRSKIISEHNSLRNLLDQLDNMAFESTGRNMVFEKLNQLLSRHIITEEEAIKSELENHRQLNP